MYAHTRAHTHAVQAAPIARFCQPGRLPDDGSFRLRSLTEASFPNDVCEISLPLPPLLTPNPALIRETPHWLTAARVIVPDAPFSILMDCTVILFSRRTSVIALSSLLLRRRRHVSDPSSSSSSSSNFRTEKNA